MEKLRLRDFLSYQFLSGLIFSPDGRHAAFVAATAKADESGYDRNLWLFNVETGALRQLTFGGDASACEWLDARTLLFSAMRDTREVMGIMFTADRVQMSDEDIVRIFAESYK